MLSFENLWIKVNKETKFFFVLKITVADENKIIHLVVDGFGDFAEEFDVLLDEAKEKWKSRN